MRGCWGQAIAWLFFYGEQVAAQHVKGTPPFFCFGPFEGDRKMSRTVIVEQKSSRSGRTKTVTRSVECELTQSMAKRMEKPRTERPESVFKTNFSVPVAAKQT